MKQFKPMQLWNVLYPVFLYYAVTILILSVVDFFLPRPMDFALLRQLITSVAVFPFLYKWYRAELFFEKKDVRIPFIAVAFLTGGCFAVALNNLLGMVRIEDYSASYGQVEQTFYTGRLLIEIVALCVVIPLVEEFLYRGMVYGRAKAWLGVKPAAVVSAVIFGVVHMNLVQFVYAAVFGVLLAYLAEQGGSIWCAVAAHMAANFTSVLRAETGVFSFLERGMAVQAVVMLLMFGAAAGGVYWIKCLK